MGICEKIWNLLNSTDKTGYVSALILLSSLSSAENFRFQFLKLRNTIKKLTKLLKYTGNLIYNLIFVIKKPSEQNIVKECCLMILRNMCSEEFMIRKILQLTDMTHIFNLLDSSDPDLQKISIEIIHELLIVCYVTSIFRHQNPEARALISSEKVISLIMNLLDSEFSIIQELALQTLKRGTLDRKFST